MKAYRITAGARFLLSDGRVAGEGDTVELEDDVAAQHRDKIEPVPPAQTSVEDAGEPHA